jgi:hypothetical protein
MSVSLIFLTASAAAFLICGIRPLLLPFRHVRESRKAMLEGSEDLLWQHVKEAPKIRLCFSLASLAFGIVASLLLLPYDPSNDLTGLLFAIPIGVVAGIIALGIEQSQAEKARGRTETLVRESASSNETAHAVVNRLEERERANAERVANDRRCAELGATSAKCIVTRSISVPPGTYVCMPAVCANCGTSPQELTTEMVTIAFSNLGELKARLPVCVWCKDKTAFKGGEYTDSVFERRHAISGVHPTFARELVLKSRVESEIGEPQWKTVMPS